MLITRVKGVIASALVFGLATFIAPANSATIAGTKCTKAGLTKSVSNIKYTCVKQGSKLLWNKGVAIKPAAKPTPSKTPSSAASANPTPTPSFNRKDWEHVYIKIWDEYKAAQSQGTFPFEYKLSPTVNKSKAEESIAAYDKAMKIWLAVLNGEKVSPVIWTIMSEKDYSWWKGVVESQEGSTPNYAWNPDTNVLGHCLLSPSSFCGYGGTYGSNTPNYKFLQYNVIGSSYTGAPNSNTVNHESVHFYQLSVVQGFPNDLPCWYVEGQASLYGGALQYNLDAQRNSSIGQRNQFKGIVRQYQPDADQFKASDWVQILNKMYYPDISCSGQQDYFKYATGMFIWEYLYANYGSKTMHQVLLDFKAGKSFQEAIQKELQVNLIELNAKLSEHLVHVFAEGN